MVAEVVDEDDDELVEVEVADVVPGDVVVLDERARVRLIRELWMVIGKTGFIP